MKGKSSDNHLKEVVKGSSLALAFKCSGILTGYIFTLLVTRYYGAEGIGIYSLSITILTILAMISMMGFDSSVVRFVAQFSVEKKLSNISLLYKNVIQATAPISILIAIFLYICKDKIAINLFNDSSLSVALTVICSIIPFFVINQLNVEVIRGFKDIKLSEYIRSLNSHLFNILFFILISFFVISYYVPLYSYSFAILISFLVSSFFVMTKLRYFPKETKQMLSRKELIKVSLPMMIAGLINFSMERIDIIMLGIFSSTENVGIYNIAVKLASLSSLCLVVINTIIAPKFSELHSSNNDAGMKQVVRFASKLMFLTSLPILLTLVVWPEFFLGLFGNEFKLGKHALIFLCIGQFVNATSGSVGYFLNMTGRQNIFRNIVLIAAVINLTLNWIMIPRYGIVGAAIATMTSVMFWNIVSVVYIKLRCNVQTFYIPGIST